MPQCVGDLQEGSKLGFRAGNSLDQVGSSRFSIFTLEQAILQAKIEEKTGGAGYNFRNVSGYFHSSNIQNCPRFPQDFFKKIVNVEEYLPLLSLSQITISTENSQYGNVYTPSTVLN